MTMSCRCRAENDTENSAPCDGRLRTSSRVRLGAPTSVELATASSAVSGAAFTAVQILLSLRAESERENGCHLAP